MRLLVDSVSRKFLSAPGFTTNTGVFSFKRNDTGEVELRFYEGATAVLLPEDTEIVWELKESGEYDADPLAAVSSFTRPGDVSGFYSGVPAFDTAALAALFSDDETAGNDVASVDVMMEVSWRESGGGWKSSVTEFGKIYNDVIKDADVLPSLENDVPAVAASVEISAQSTTNVGDQVGYIDINGWRVNFHYTAGAGTPGSGALLAWGTDQNWGEIFAEIAQVINGASTSYTLTDDPGEHPTVSAVASDDGTTATLTLTADTAGVAGNAITYELVDSNGTESESGTLAGGADSRAIEVDDLLVSSHSQSLSISQRDQLGENWPEAVNKDVIYGDLQKLATKLAANPDYQARVLVIGDSMIDNMTEDFGERLRGPDDVASAMWGCQVIITNVLDDDLLRWPTRQYSRLDGTNTSSTIGRNGTAAMHADKLVVGYIAESGAGTFSVEYAESTSGPWTSLAASVDADNAGTAEGVVLEYDLPEGDWVGRVSRIAGTTDFVLGGFENSGTDGGLMWMPRGGLDIDSFVQTPQAITAPIVAAFDPDIIVWDAADSAAEMEADLETFIGKLIADVSEDPGVILLARNPWRDDTDDSSQIAQANWLRSHAEAQGYGFFDIRSVLRTGTLADTLGLVEPSGNVHLSEKGEDLKLSILTDLWPNVFGFNRRLPQASKLVYRDQPITRQTFREAVDLFNPWTQVDLGLAESATVSGGTVTNDAGLLVTGINSGVTSGSAKQILRDYVASGVSGGTRFQDGKIAFHIKMFGRIFQNAEHYFFIGPDDYTLSDKGFGIKIDENGFYAIAHDGTTPAISGVLPGSADLVSGAMAAEKEISLLVEHESGTVSVYLLDRDGLGNREVRLMDALSGGPTTGGASGASGQRYFMMTSDSTGVSSGNVTRSYLAEAKLRFERA